MPVRRTSALPLARIAAVCLIPMLGACGALDLKQLTYEMLAQEDCLRNELDEFCHRGYAHEYQEYERARQEYLRDLADDSGH